MISKQERSFVHVHDNVTQLEGQSRYRERRQSIAFSQKVGGDDWLRFMVDRAKKEKKVRKKKTLDAAMAAQPSEDRFFSDEANGQGSVQRCGEGRAKAVNESGAFFFFFLRLRLRWVTAFIVIRIYEGSSGGSLPPFFISLIICARDLWIPLTPHSSHVHYHYYYFIPRLSS